jgi:hypothetical protein
MPATNSKNTNSSNTRRLAVPLSRTATTTTTTTTTPTTATTATTAAAPTETATSTATARHQTSFHQFSVKNSPCPLLRSLSLLSLLFTTAALLYCKDSGDFILFACPILTESVFCVPFLEWHPLRIAR